MQKFDSDNALPLAKTLSLSMHNVAILIKLVFNKNHQY